MIAIIVNETCEIPTEQQNLGHIVFVLFILWDKRLWLVAALNQISASLLRHPFFTHKSALHPFFTPFSTGHCAFLYRLRLGNQLERPRTPILPWVYAVCLDTQGVRSPLYAKREEGLEVGVGRAGSGGRRNGEYWKQIYVRDEIKLSRTHSGG